jgi:hypothetical protein
MIKSARHSFYFTCPKPMPDLAHSLPSKDLGFLRIVAGLWGLELASSEAPSALDELAEALCDAELAEEIVSTLPQEGRAALDALIERNGRMPWVAFTRRFGEVREMGPGKRDREQPHLNPASATEILWYRALVTKAFFDAEKGPQEFAYIPDDLFMALDFAGLVGSAGPVDESMQEETVSAEEFDETAEDVEIESVEATVPDETETLTEIREEIKVIKPGAKNGTDIVVQIGDALGRPASPSEKAFPLPASDQLLDDSCTLLAALRSGLEPPETKIPVKVVHEFLSVAKMIRAGVPQPEPVKNFLAAQRAAALELLVAAWQDSVEFNELRQLPGLACEGEWKNEPHVTREFVLNLLEPVPDGQWWSIPAFVRDVKTKYPDFQRPAGDYDSWFIRREVDGLFLRGFAHWDAVDGALIRYVFQVLYWLGQVELAATEEGGAPTAFRAAPNTAHTAEDAKLIVTSQGKIVAPRLAPRAARYQVARFCEWDDEKEAEYRYRVTPGSLKRAQEQGLKVEHLLSVLRKHASAPLPPPFVKALQRWEVNGSEARVEHLTVLKVARPEVMHELRSSKAGRFLGEILGPTTVVIKNGAESKIIAALAELGLLADGHQKSDAET